MGTFKTHERLRQRYWWPYMERDILHHIRACDPCNHANAKTPPHTPPTRPIPAPAGPNNRIHADLFGPLATPGGKGRSKYVLVITDAFTKLVQLSIIPDKEATTVATAILHGWIYTYGVPLEYGYTLDSPETGTDGV